MMPSDYRDLTWDKLQERLEGLRLKVYDAWQQHGPGTTREVAMRAQFDLLTFRPRSTELFQMGLIQLSAISGQRSASADESHRLHEGVYEAVPIEAARAAHERRLLNKPDEQLLMASV